MCVCIYRYPETLYARARPRNVSYPSKSQTTPVWCIRFPTSSTLLRSKIDHRSTLNECPIHKNYQHNIILYYINT